MTKGRDDDDDEKEGGGGGGGGGGDRSEAGEAKFNRFKGNRTQKTSENIIHQPRVFIIPKPPVFRRS